VVIIYETKRFVATLAEDGDLSISIAAPTIFELGFTPESLIIDNQDDDAIIYFSDDEGVTWTPVTAGRTWETSSLETSFWIYSTIADADYEFLGRVN